MSYFPGDQNEFYNLWKCARLMAYGQTILFICQSLTYINHPRQKESKMKWERNKKYKSKKKLL